MKKVLILLGASMLLGLLLSNPKYLEFPILTLAEAYEDVRTVALGSATITNVAVASTSVTTLDLAARLLEGRYRIEVWNDDPGATIFVGFNVNLSTINGNALFGRRLATRSSVTYDIPDSVRVYARAVDNSTATAVITQFK